MATGIITSTSIVKLTMQVVLTKNASVLPYTHYVQEDLSSVIPTGWGIVDAVARGRSGEPLPVFHDGKTIRVCAYANGDTLTVTTNIYIARGVSI